MSTYNLHPRRPARTGPLLTACHDQLPPDILEYEVGGSAAPPSQARVSCGALSAGRWCPLRRRCLVEQALWYGKVGRDSSGFLNASEYLEKWTLLGAYSSADSGKGKVHRIQSCIACIAYLPRPTPRPGAVAARAGTGTSWLGWDTEPQSCHRAAAAFSTSGQPLPSFSHTVPCILGGFAEEK